MDNPDKWYISGPLGIGALEPAGKLDVQGDIRAGNSDLYFTKTDHEHTGIGNTTGYAAIENASNFDALMILGRAGTDKGRKVRLWDYLEVNGPLAVQGDIRAGNSDLYFTKTDHAHSGIGNTAGYAAIENASDLDALAILGRAGTDKGRKVRLWDYLEVIGPLVVQGNIQAANSDIYFTKTDHAHSGVGNTAGHAAIENASDFDALMILGRAGAGTGAPRKVKLWDYLEVNGNLNVTGTISLSGELPFHYATFIAKFGERSIDTRWEVSKYVVVVVGFDFSRPGIQAYIDRSAPTSQIKYNSQSAGSDGVIYVLRIRKELVSGL